MTSSNVGWYRDEKGRLIPEPRMYVTNTDNTGERIVSTQSRFVPIEPKHLDMERAAYLVKCAASYYMLPEDERLTLEYKTFYKQPKSQDTLPIMLVSVYYDGQWVEDVHAMFLEAAYTAVPEPQTIPPDEAAKLMYDVFHIGEER